jgi:NADPH2 dehydrogenase
MGMTDPVPQFSHLVKNMRDRFPRLAYLHVIEEHMHGTDRRMRAGASNQFLRDIWGRDRRYIASAGFDRQKGIDMAESQGVLVAYGRLFLANVSPSVIL